MDSVSTRTESILLRLPAELKAQIEDAAVAARQSANTWLNMAVKAVLENDLTGTFDAGRASGQADAIKGVIDHLDRTRAALKSWQHMVETRRDLDEAKRVTFQDLAESFTAIREAPEGGGASRMTTSMYDDFWRPLLSDVEKALGTVADTSRPQTIDLPGLTDYGNRPAGWSGSARVWDKGHSSTSGTAAHVKSLVRLLITEAIPERWPGNVFRVSVNTKGNMLTIKAA